MCHDYGPTGATSWETTVGAEKAQNVHVGKGEDEEEFVKCRRTRRDARHAETDHPVAAGQHAGGHMPPKDKDGKTLLKVPVNGL